jgi:hypothetical protein
MRGLLSNYNIQDSRYRYEGFNPLRGFDPLNFNISPSSNLETEGRLDKIAGQLWHCGWKHYFVKGFLLRFWPTKMKNNRKIENDLIRK